MSKFNLKKIFCTFTAGVLAFSLTSFSVSAAAFSDIEGHWAQDVIEKWSEKGVIEGYEGRFNPDDNITRGDMAIVLDKLMNYSDKSENLFSDLEDDAYYADSVLKLNKAGIMFGSDGEVRPRDFITREEAFVMLDRIYDFEGSSRSTGFEDEGDVSDWAKDAVLAMCENKIINGRDGRINPKLNITRAEIIQLLECILSYAGNIIGKTEEDFDISFGNDHHGGISGGITIGGGNSGGSSGNSTGGNVSGDNTGDDDSDTNNENSIGADDIEAGGIW